MIQIKIAFLPVTLLILIALLVFSFSNARMAYADTTKNFGNLLVEVGYNTRSENN
jgi:hypothetical protein